AKGLVWDEANLTVYVQDPTKFLDEFTGNPKLKSKMVFKVKKEEDAANVAAFLASLSPAAGEAPAATE
ncbi:MAG: c-type cytochrome, partial [Cereibacter sp.]